MTMFAPPHPGEILKDEVLDELELSITDAAELLGVSRKTLSKVTNGRGSITPEMALRLERYFKPSADMWLRMQNAFDLSHTRAEIKRGTLILSNKALKRDSASGSWRVVNDKVRKGVDGNSTTVVAKKVAKK